MQDLAGQKKDFSFQFYVSGRLIKARIREYDQVCVICGCCVVMAG